MKHPPATIASGSGGDDRFAPLMNSLRPYNESSMKALELVEENLKILSAAVDRSNADAVTAARDELLGHHQLLGRIQNAMTGFGPPPPNPMIPPPAPLAGGGDLIVRRCRESSKDSMHQFLFVDQKVKILGAALDSSNPGAVASAGDEIVQGLQLLRMVLRGMTAMINGGDLRFRVV